MPFIVVIAIIAWDLIGSPLKDIANILWKTEAAPWETVDAYYYPDRYRLGRYIFVEGLQTVDDCRAWVSSQARLYNDPSIVRGDYECGIQKLETWNGLSVYRMTVK